MTTTEIKRRRNGKQLPLEIEEAMIAKKEYRADVTTLSRMTEVPAPTLYHIFSKEKHLHLSKFKRTAEALSFGLDEFLDYLLLNTREQVKALITEKLRCLETSSHDFHQAYGVYHYFSENISFRTLRTYAQIAKGLGITLDDLADIFLIDETIDKNSTVDKIVA